MANIIETLPNEGEDLALHVELCHQRYLQLINKFDEVDSRLDEINTVLTEIKAGLENKQSLQLKMYLGWTITAIVAMGGWIVHLLAR